MKKQVAVALLLCAIVLVLVPVSIHFVKEGCNSPQCAAPADPVTDQTEPTTEAVPTKPSELPVSEPPQEPEKSSKVPELLKAMSLREKITQMLMVDIQTWGAEDFTVMNEEVRDILAEYKFGAIILFAGNAQGLEQTFELVSEFQSSATADGGIPMLIAMDQEGGSVYRLGSGTALPGNMALGATYAQNGTKYATYAGKVIGSELSALGINTALAPVVDVNSNPNNPVIGLRSFSDDATVVGEMAAGTVTGMAEYQVIGCAKHFPGHGDTATDSHYGLPLVDKPLSILQQNELKPYETLIEQGVEMIMTTHILYPQLESDQIVSTKTGKAESLPATMSDDILAELLKKDMGFGGIVITDAMNMAGVADKWHSTQSIVIAIAAGADMICMPCQLSSRNDLSKLDAIIDAVEQAVTEGTISIERIDDAVTRILTVKENRGILDYDAAKHALEEAKQMVGSEENRAMERELSAAAVTVIRNEESVLPLKLQPSSRVLMLVPYQNERGQMIMGWNRAKEAGLIPEGAQVRHVRYSSSSSIEALKPDLDWADIFVVISEISNAERVSGNHWLYRLPKALSDYAASNGKKSIVISAEKPYDVQFYPNADAVVACYGCKGSPVDADEALAKGTTVCETASGPNLVAAVEVILGTYGAQGKLPLDIPAYGEKEGGYLEEIVFERGYGLTSPPLE